MKKLYSKVPLQLHQKLKVCFNMKGFIFCFFVSFFLLHFSLYAQNELDEYIQSFNYESRKEMKLTSKEITQLLIEDEAVLVDIRFKEEQEAWGMPFAVAMPLPSLSKRYKELPKNRLIVTACPHKDRAIIAMLFLKSKGFKVAYLKHGLLDLASYLRGDAAADFIQQMPKK